MKGQSKDSVAFTGVVLCSLLDKKYRLLACEAIPGEAVFLPSLLSQKCETIVERPRF